MLTLMFDIGLILEHMAQICAMRCVLGIPDIEFHVKYCIAQK